MRTVRLVPLLLFALALPATAAVANISPDVILTTEPIPTTLPAFHEADCAGVSWDDLLQEMPDQPGPQRPDGGATFNGQGDAPLAWSILNRASDEFHLSGSSSPTIQYFAVYLDSDRWQKQNLTVSTELPMRGTLDRQELTFADSDSGHTVELTLPLGKHLLVLRTLHHEETSATWNLGVRLSGDSSGLRFSTDPTRSADIHDILDAPRASNITVSPDGRLTAITVSSYSAQGTRSSWLEVRQTKSGKLVRTWRGQKTTSQVQWFPRGHRLTWRTDQDDRATLRTFDLDSGETAAVLTGVKDLGGWAWAPDGESIVYEITRRPEPNPRRVKRVMYPADRQPWWRTRKHLMQVFVPGGVTRRLTAGPLSPNAWQLSPDSRQLVFFTTDQDLRQRPYFASDIWLLDMASLSLEKVLSDPWLDAAVWSPDSKQLLLHGSPSAFDNLGRDLPPGVQANEYSQQLYLFDLTSRQPEVITLDLKPDVSSATWSRADGMIYALTAETQYNPLYRTKPGSGKWVKVATGLDVTNQISLASEKAVAVVRGSSVTQPNTLRAVDLKRNRSRLLLDPGADNYREVTFGKVENWVAKLDKGMDMDGFIYYPPGFDPERKYPVIVYYYGGTIAITRDFGGRYPKNIWAGQGYVVYVPNPSGATGYGQEFTARHVNDWGKLSGAEIIEGTKKFLAAHPFADPDHVACMGASYGGFLTDYILTQTDIFAAAISHAGISDITSYWGEGFWGYDYGSIALAGSFPWKNPEIFVDQSPLFHADQVTTPLLLLHGDADVNVPKGESIQFFTALKMLGQDVEYVEIFGQDHHIVDHAQRITWNDTILAYLAKYLKERPAWWDEMYPAPKDYR